MTDATPFARNASKRQPDEAPLECEATYTLDRQLAQWRAETSPERISQLNAEWETSQ